MTGTATAAPTGSTVVGLAAPGGLTIDQALTVMQQKRQGGAAPAPSGDKPAAGPSRGEVRDAVSKAAKDEDEDEPGKAPAPGVQAEDGSEAPEGETPEGEELEAEEGDDQPSGDVIELADGTTIPVEEAVKAFQNFKALQGRVTRKEQELAQQRAELEDTRKAVEADRQGFTEHRQKVETAREELTGQLTHYQTVLGEIAKAIEAKEDPWAGVDWVRLARERTPQEYNAFRAEYDLWRERRTAAIRQVEEARGEAAKKAAKLTEEREAEAMRALNAWAATKHPDWNDQAKREADHGAMWQTAKTVGYGEQEINATRDPRAWEILWKAAQYDRLQAQKGSVLKQAKPEGKPDGSVRVLKAGASAPRATPDTVAHATLASRHAKLKSTGSIDDALAVLQAKRAYRAAGAQRSR